MIKQYYWRHSGRIKDPLIEDRWCLAGLILLQVQVQIIVQLFNSPAAKEKKRKRAGWAIKSGCQPPGLI
jgi:hypothetical protein